MEVSRHAFGELENSSNKVGMASYNDRPLFILGLDVGS